tara:strand:+ start:65 stop:526 length:462 start_codon:yes stop_codon:yes gene_type:complete
MNEKMFCTNHHRRVNNIAHTSGLGLLVPSDDSVMDKYIVENPNAIALHNSWISDINDSHVSNTIKSIRRKLVNKKIVDIYLTKFIANRIKEKEQLVLGIEKWRLSISPPPSLNGKESLQWRFDNLKGWRRFTLSKQTFNYYIETNRYPYTFSP